MTTQVWGLILVLLPFLVLGIILYLEGTGILENWRHKDNG